MSMTTTTLTDSPKKMTRTYRVVLAVLRFLYNVFFKIDEKGWERTPVTGGLLIGGNHTKLWEGPLVLARSPRQPLSALAKLEYKGSLIGRFFLEPIDVIYINREEMDRTALKDMLRRLKTGYAIGIAPEGTRSKTGKLQEGKEGTAYMMLQTGAQFLPVAIWGHEDLGKNLRRLRRCPVHIRVGHPIKLESDPALSRQENIARGTDQIMLAVARLLPPEYRGFYGDRVLGPPDWS